MNVLFKPLNTVGTILSLPNKSNDVQIQIGNAKMTANLNWGKYEKCNIFS